MYLIVSFQGYSWVNLMFANQMYTLKQYKKEKTLAWNNKQ